MKKLIALLLGLIMALSLAACSGQTDPIKTGDPVPGETESSQIPNPMVGCENAEAFKALGITMDAPEGATDVSYFIISDTLAHIAFTYEGVEYVYRASATDSDISGVFDTFAPVFTMYLVRDFDNLTAEAVTGSEGGSLVTWNADGINYALYAATGVEEEPLRACVKACMEKTFTGVIDAVQQSDGVVELAQDATVNMDLNGDGVMETITFEYIPEQDYNLARTKLIITNDSGVTAELLTDMQGLGTGFAYDVDRDGMVEIFISGDVCSCDYSTWLVRFDGEKIIPAESIYEAGDDGIQPASAAGSVVAVNAEDMTVTVSNTVDIIGSWGCETQYQVSSSPFALVRVEGSVWTKYNENGVLDPEYWDYCGLVTVNELPYTPEGESAETMLPVGEKLVLVETDGETYFRFETQSGIKGVIKTERSTDDSFWGFRIAGQEEGYYFETVPYAG